MNSDYEKLIEEGYKLKSEYQKTKYMNKLFIRLIVIGMYTYVISYIFSKINLVINFYDEFIFNIFFIITFFRMVFWIERKNKKKQRQVFAIYILLSSINLILYCDFSNLVKVFISVIIVSIIYYIFMKFSKCNITTNIMIGVCIFSLCMIVKISKISFFALEISILLALIIFRHLNLLVKNSYETIDDLQTRFYGYLFCLYTLFISASIVIM